MGMVWLTPDEMEKLLAEDAGAIKKGARVEKVRGEPEDVHPVGIRGTVMAGWHQPMDLPFGHVEDGYFVMFDGGIGPTFVVDLKIKEVTDEYATARS